MIENNCPFERGIHVFFQGGNVEETKSYFLKGIETLREILSTDASGTTNMATTMSQARTIATPMLTSIPTTRAVPLEIRNMVVRMFDASSLYKVVDPSPLDLEPPDVPFTIESFEGFCVWMVSSRSHLYLRPWSSSSFFSSLSQPQPNPNQNPNKLKKPHNHDQAIFLS
eukprot:TRINITY_DN6477_c0_g1_i1.p1 TRINITY_DN6477_c0_g1~~TRINITY_DN6477_c0_g1_i1.p1  ORF type:complete len:169 (-),score=24.13 TRINITY_DN6477_c0_g1_i1:15-521(-)